MASATAAIQALLFDTVAGAITGLVNNSAPHTRENDMIVAAAALSVPSVLTRDQRVAVAQFVCMSATQGTLGANLARDFLEEAGITKSPVRDDIMQHLREQNLLRAVA